MNLFTRLLIPAALLVLTSRAAAQDKVTYRDRTGKGVQTASGKIDAESLAGVRIGGRTIPGTDILVVQYDVPGSIRLDYNAAIAAEAKIPAEALMNYDALLRTGPVQNLKSVKRHLEYKVAALTTARAEEGPDQLQ